MTDKPTIPEPTEGIDKPGPFDHHIDLESWYKARKKDVQYAFGKVSSSGDCELIVILAIIRRCHAAEQRCAALEEIVAGFLYEARQDDIYECDICLAARGLGVEPKYWKGEGR